MLFCIKYNQTVKYKEDYSVDGPFGFIFSLKERAEVFSLKISNSRHKLRNQSYLFELRLRLVQQTIDLNRFSP